MIDEIYKINSHNKEYRNKTIFDNGNDPIYGETTQKGVDGIVNHFKDHFNENTVFYDLGCGLGKMVAHIGIQYKVKKSCGVELSKERLKAAYDIKEKYCKDDTTISYIEGDFYKMDLSDATVVYFDNTAMFQKEFIINLYNKLPKGCLFLYRAGTFSRSEGKEYNEKVINSDKFITTYYKTKLHYIIIE